MKFSSKFVLKHIAQFSAIALMIFVSIIIGWGILDQLRIGPVYIQSLRNLSIFAGCARENQDNCILGGFTWLIFSMLCLFAAYIFGHINSARYKTYATLGILFSVVVLGIIIGVRFHP